MDERARSQQAADAAASPTPRVVIVGSVNQDLVIKVHHLPIAGETQHGAELVSSPGGKGANQAVAAARLGVRSAIVGRVGHDTIGVDLCARLDSEGVDTTRILPTRDTPSGVALIVVRPDGENTITVAGGANLQFSVADVLAARDVIAAADAVLLQLEIPPEANLAAIELAREAGALVAINAAPLPRTIGPVLREVIASVDILVVNEVEASQLLSIPHIAESAAARAAAARDLRGLGPDLAVITLGSEGAIAATGTETLFVPSHDVKAVDGVGAGDAFCAGLAIATLEGRGPREALSWATACGALATTQVGAQASLPRRQEVKMQLELAQLLR